MSCSSFSCPILQVISCSWFVINSLIDSEFKLRLILFRTFPGNMDRFYLLVFLITRARRSSQTKGRNSSKRNSSIKREIGWRFGPPLSCTSIPCSVLQVKLALFTIRDGRTTASLWYPSIQNSNTGLNMLFKSRTFIEYFYQSCIPIHSN